MWLHSRMCVQCGWYTLWDLPKKPNGNSTQVFHNLFHQRRPLNDDVCGRCGLPSRLFWAHAMSHRGSMTGRNRVSQHTGKLPTVVHQNQFFSVYLNGQNVNGHILTFLTALTLVWGLPVDGTICCVRCRGHILPFFTTFWPLFRGSLLVGPCVVWECSDIMCKSKNVS